MRSVEVRSVVMRSGLLRHGESVMFRFDPVSLGVSRYVGHGSVCCDEVGSSQVGRSSCGV